MIDDNFDADPGDCEEPLLEAIRKALEAEKEA